MNLEIERKFLVGGDQWKTGDLVGVRLVQAYLDISVDPPRSVRVRLDDRAATVCIKAALSEMSRYEWEYEIPVSEAVELIEMVAQNLRIEKTRYTFVELGTTWQIDEFGGSNTGLVVAEAEAPPSAGEEWMPSRPSWLGVEVTNTIRYLNELLTIRPYSTWPPEHRTGVGGSTEECPPDWDTLSKG